MKVGYSLIDRSSPADGGAPPRYTNSSHHLPPSTAEGALLLVVAVLGGLGNIFAMLVTLLCPAFRQMSSAFLFHHCLLDAVKSGFCLPFGYSLLLHTSIPHCDVLGAGYILLMTVSAYNLLALLVNEEYQCSFTTRRDRRGEGGHGDSCCVAFGVVIIWFTTVLLHLGVAFLPGSSEFNHEVGNCVYQYGVTKNYVIHALWVILVTGAVVVAAVSFFHFFRKLRSSARSRKWTFLHKSLSSLSASHNAHSHHHHHQHHQQHHHHHYNSAGGENTTTTFTTTPTADQLAEEVHYEFDDVASQKAMLQTRRYLRRIVTMMLMVVSFVLCWYPLFTLILLDVHYRQPPHVYRFLMIVAWTHPVTTPIFCGVIYYDMASGAKVTRDVYSNAIPMTTSVSGDAIRQEMMVNHQMYAGPATGSGGISGGGISGGIGGIGFHNENFHFTPNHVGEGGGAGGGAGAGGGGALSSSSPRHHATSSASGGGGGGGGGGSETDSTHCDVSTQYDLSMAAQCDASTAQYDAVSIGPYEVSGHCETIINYNTDEGGCQTLIM